MVSRGGQTGPPLPGSHGKSWPSCGGLLCPPRLIDLPRRAPKEARHGKSFRKNKKRRRKAHTGLDLGRTGPRSRRRRRSAAVTWIRRSSSPVAPPSDPPSAPPPGPPPPGSARCRRGRRRSRQIRPPRPRHRRIRRRGLHRGRPRLDLPAGTWICPVEKGKEELAADPASPAAPPPDPPPRPPAGPPSPGSAQRRRGRRGSRRIWPPRPRHRRIRCRGLRQGRRRLDLPSGEGEGGACGRSGLLSRATTGPAAVHA